MNCTGTSCNQGRKMCATPEACGLVTQNSDGSDPHAETRDLIGLALDAGLVLLVLAAVTFFVFAALGHWSAR